MALTVFTSNRLEVLGEMLARTVQTPLPNPLTPETIIVQSRGMERWISMELAKRHGIWANCRFPFPNVFLQQVFCRLLPDITESTDFEPEILTLRIMKTLPNCLRRSGFEPLRIYLADDSTQLKLVQLSRKLADMYDQYEIFRPEMITAWEKGILGSDPDERWQAELWQDLLRDTAGLHRAELRSRALNRLSQAEPIAADLPPRVAVFGISYLPRFHLESLAELARHMELNFFLLNPSREFWADILSEREIHRIRRRHPHMEQVMETLHLESGHRLLASMGKQGRDFLRIISGFDCDIQDQFEEPRGDSLLSRIQGDILHLTNRTDAGADASAHVNAATRVSPQDRSIQIHSCHSPMREVEVLRDHLLAMFEEDPDLQPNGIIVMTPDIDQYSPYIQAVFDPQTDPALHIPFSIADRSARNESRSVEGFLALLDLKDSRLGAAQILGLLEYPVIREKFDLTDQDMTSLESWIQETEIRWGLDETSRTELGLPAFRENTWRSGLERLLLGYALPNRDRSLFAGILPYDHIEGSDGRTLGKFLSFFDAVLSCREQLRHAKTLSQWHQSLNEIVTLFFGTAEETAADIQGIRQVLQHLVAMETSSGFDQPLEFDAIGYLLRSRLEVPRFGSGFLSGGVTFCAMLPMRSIPFKVVCLIGMDSDAFPRDVQPLAFDLMEKYPKRGDRSRRNDDKYLFLEAILSARQILYLSYVGQDIQDNSLNPPSVLVSELLDTLEADFQRADGASIRDQMIVQHRLQPFSAAYFQQNDRLFSYSQQDLRVAEQARFTRSPTAFISAGLPWTSEDQDTWKTIDLETLCRFFSNPAKFLLQQRLGVFLEDKTAVYAEAENLELTPLTRYVVEQNLFKAKLEGWDLKDFRPIQNALGHLSHGNVGLAQYNDLSVGIDAFVTRIRRFTQNKIKTALSIDLEIGRFHLTGRLGDIFGQGQVHLRYAKLRPKDVLRTWLYHLVFCEAGAGAGPATSTVIGRDSAWSFGPFARSRIILQDLIELFRQGLCEPIRFFPEAAWEYVSRRQKNPSDDAGAMDAARAKWMANDFSTGEGEDPYYLRCFGHMDPIDRTFAQLAEKVFLPLLKHGTPAVL